MMSKDYIPLFPLLADYWDKPLAELPEELRVRVKKREAIEDKTHVIGYKPKMDANGDLIPNADGSYPAWEEEYATRYEGDFILSWDELKTVERRKEMVIQIDDHNDPNSIANTVTELVMYLGTDDGLQGELGVMIGNARSKGQSSVAVTLKELSDELAVIVNADNHRSVSDSSPWRKLYLFSKKLPAMKDAAKGRNDYDLALALDDVSKQIERILDIDRERVGDDVVAAIDAEDTQRVTPTATTDTGRDGATVGQDKPMPIIQQRCNAILHWLTTNKHNPLNLPPPQKQGLSTVKADCRKVLCQNKKMFSSRSLFDKAWQQLHDDKKVKWLVGAR